MCRCHDLHCSSLKESMKREMKTIIEGGMKMCLTMHLRTSLNVSFQVFSANFERRSEIMVCDIIPKAQKTTAFNKIHLK